MFPVSVLFAQTPGEVYQNANVLATVWQHDRRVSFRQPHIWEWSKYRCHEHTRRGFTEHQRAVLIFSHPDVIPSSSHGSPAEGALTPHLSSSCHSSLRASGLSCEIGTFFLTLLWCHISFASWISIPSSQRSESAMLELIVVTFTHVIYNFSLKVVVLCNADLGATVD